MLPDLVKITGLSIFEILLQSVGLIVFLGMLALKLENIYNITWWYVFCPLLVANGLCLYFSFIVFIRSYNSQSHKTGAYKRAIWILLAYSLLIVHELLLCYTLQEAKKMRISVISAPCYVGWVLLLIRMCKTN